MTRRGPRAPTRALAAGATVAALALAGCSADEGGTPGLRAEAEQAFVSGDGSVQVIVPADRQAVDPVAGETLDGDRLDLADLAGHPWC